MQATVFYFQPEEIYLVLVGPPAEYEEEFEVIKREVVGQIVEGVEMSDAELLALAAGGRV